MSVTNTNGIPKRFKKGHYYILIKNRINHPKWKGGRSKDKDGYWRYQLPDYFSARRDGRVLEHVYNFQEYHRCCMLKWGVIHHVDENKENNMVWNLRGMTRGQHMSLHGKKDMSSRRCFKCGSDKTYIQKKGTHQWHFINNQYYCNKCGLKIRWDLRMIGKSDR